MSSKADRDNRAYVTQRDIEDGLKRVGLQLGDCVLVHSSLSRFGYVEGGVMAGMGANAIRRKSRHIDNMPCGR